MTGYIYRIWNDINNKNYIGKTLNTIEERWKQHCNDRTKRIAENRPLYRAMNKYGIEHFHIELVEECDELILSNREIYWIEYYHGYSEGYNATLGGDGKSLYDHEEIIALYIQGLTCKEISEQIGCCVDIIYNTLNRVGINPHINSYKQRSNLIRATFKDGSTKDFESTSDAARWLVTNNYTKAKDERGIVTNIGRVAKGQQNRKSYLGIKWSYID